MSHDSCPTILTQSVAKCAQICADGGATIKQSPRLMSLSQSADVDARTRGFFAHGGCLRCVSRAFASKTPNKAHGYPTAGALGCLPLGPSHAFYDKLLREWMGRHGREKACALESDRDMVRDACIPLVAPLTTFRDLCDPKREAWYTYA